jgi:copper chaperone NosL
VLSHRVAKTHLEENVKLYVDRFQEFLARPMALGSRLPMALLVIPLVAAIMLPLWQISMTAPQYLEGLYLDIYAYKLVGGNNGYHIKEINTLNHYIGMRPIDEAAAADLDWIPFALGAMVLMTLRVAAAGTVKDLVDLVVVTGYFSLFAFGRFVYRLWVFGHTLAHDAPVRIDGFMPVIFGHKTVANFETYSYPQAGAFCLGAFVLGTVAILGWHLVTGRRKAVREAEVPPA